MSHHDTVRKESEEMENKVIFKIRVNGLDEVQEKVSEINKLLKEAKSLADELASMNCKIIVQFLRTD